MKRLHLKKDVMSFLHWPINIIWLDGSKTANQSDAMLENIHQRIVILESNFAEIRTPDSPFSLTTCSIDHITISSAGLGQWSHFPMMAVCDTYCMIEGLPCSHLLLIEGLPCSHLLLMWSIRTIHRGYHSYTCTGRQMPTMNNDSYQPIRWNIYPWDISCL